MSSTITINSIVEKLLNIPTKAQQLIFNSDAALQKINYLKAKINRVYYSIEETSFVALGALLQNVDLNIFTVPELVVLLRFDYTHLENSSAVGEIKCRDLIKPYYDLDGIIINMSDEESYKIDKEFSYLHATNRSLSLEFLASFIIAQI